MTHVIARSEPTKQSAYLELYHIDGLTNFIGGKLEPCPCFAVQRIDMRFAEANPGLTEKEMLLWPTGRLPLP